MSKTRLSLILGGVLALQALASAAKLDLGTDRNVYLPFQPVFLNIRADAEAGQGMDPNPLETGDLVLEITPPDGHAYRYAPGMTLCRLAGSGNAGAARSVFHTLSYGAGRPVLEAPGEYALRLLDPQGAAMSPVRKITVEMPSSPNDKQAYERISANPGQFAYFQYLEGSEQLAEGLAIAEDLAAMDCSYSPTARALLAIHYSQSFPRGRDGKPRARDFGKSEHYLMDSFDQVGDYLQGKMLYRAGQFGKERFTAGLQGKLKQAKQRWAGKSVLLENKVIRDVMDF